MARKARLIVPGLPHHIYQRGNNRQTVFKDDEDKTSYLDWLREAAHLYRVDVHAYVLLDDSVRFLVTPVDDSGLARMMQWVGRLYVPYFNKKYNRSGTLWEGRFKTSVVEESWVIRCSCFIEMLPVIHKAADHSGNYIWSSYRHHVGISPSSLIRDHAFYWNLGNTPFAREVAYKTFFSHVSQENMVLDPILEKGWPLGSDGFVKRLEQSTQRQFRMGKRGRPSKS